MNMKQQLLDRSPALRKIRKGIFVSLTPLLLSACVAPPPFITFSEPKIYSNDQVAIALNDQYRKLQISAAAAKLTAKDVQTIFAIKQARSLDVNIAASPAGTTPVTAPDKLAADKIDLSKLTAPDGEIGLSYIASLRKKMSNEWETLGRSLSLSGDQTLKNADNLVLVRFDVGINNYIPSDLLWDTQRFYYIQFTLCEREQCKPSTEPSKSPFKVYALQPEFNSAVSEESLITQVLENYQGEVGGIAEGVNLQGAMGYQRGLHEGITQLVEEPLQFAVYGTKPNEFICALGPTRKIVKRSWINPARIFGDTYRIDHIIEPGTRQCYVLISLTENNNNLPGNLYVNIKTYRSDDFNNRCGLFDNDEWKRLGSPEKKAPSYMPKDINSCGLVNLTDKFLSGYRELIWGEQWTNSNHEFDIMIPEKLKSTDISVSDLQIYPKTTSTILVNTPSPFYPDSSVIIGPVTIAPENIDVLGTNLIKVTVPPDEVLQTLLNESNIDKQINNDQQPLWILTPGCTSSNECKQKIGTVQLKDSGEPPTKPTTDKTLKEVVKKFVYP